MTGHRFPYPVRRLLRLDKWTNYNLFNGWRKETISSRCGKAQLRRIHDKAERGDWVWLSAGWVIDLWFLWDRPHCLRAIQYDDGRPAIPDQPDLRWTEPDTN